MRFGEEITMAISESEGMVNEAICDVRVGSSSRRLLIGPVLRCRVRLIRLRS